MTQDHPEPLDPAGEGAGDDPELVSDDELEDLEDDDGGPDASELDDEPDYNPDDPGLKGIKGG